MTVPATVLAAAVAAWDAEMTSTRRSHTYIADARNAAIEVAYQAGRESVGTLVEQGETYEYTVRATYDDGDTDGLHHVSRVRTAETDAEAVAGAARYLSDPEVVRVEVTCARQVTYALNPVTLLDHKREVAS